MQKRITERAYDVFRNRGAALGAALSDWLAAERQTIWKPPIEVCQKGMVHVCEFQPGPLFRAIRFPAPIDPEAVKAECRDGLLRVTAAIAAKQQAKKVDVQAA